MNQMIMIWLKLLQFLLINSMDNYVEKGCDVFADN